MAHQNDFKADLHKWVAKAFKGRFSSFDIQIESGSEKGLGYASEIKFVRVVADNNQEFRLALKYCKKELASSDPTSLLAFNRETSMFGVIIPTLRGFQEEKGLALLNYIPECFYASMETPQMGVLMFQNLRVLGYDLHPSDRPLNLEHLRVTLSNYGKWHGLSMAYRDQKPREFEKLTEKVDRLLVYYMTASVKNMVNQAEVTSYTALEKKGETKLKEELKRLMPLGMFAEYQRVLALKQKTIALLHGDCWNNNHMFKYKGHSKTQPEQNKFVDFQLSMLGTPVYDLSYHVYATASEEQLSQFDHLLATYHSSLSESLKALGSDPKLYPMTELREHWRLYSSFGLIMALMTVSVGLSDQKDTIDFQDMAGDKYKELMEKIQLKNFDKLSERIIAILKHWVATQRRCSI